MKINLLLIGTLMCTSATYAQNMFSMASVHPADTLRSELQEQAIRFPSLRKASVTGTIFGNNKFTSKLNGNDLAEGKTRNARISSYFSVPISSWNSNIFGASIYHTENFFNVRQANNHLNDPRITKGRISKSTLGLSLNFSRTDAIFHTPVIYSAVVTGISDDLSTVRRFNFNGSIVFPLKRTADTYISLGALLQVDPSAPIPVIPVINYFHKLNDNGLQLIVDLPQGASVKQALSKKAWVYLGSSYSTYVSFFKAGGQALPDRFSFNTIEVKNGPGFEYLLSKYLMLGVSAGINKIVSGRVIAKGDSFGNPFIETTNNATAYGELHISFLPFKS